MISLRNEHEITSTNAERRFGGSIDRRRRQGRFLLLQNLHSCHPWQSDSAVEPKWMYSRRPVKRVAEPPQCLKLVEVNLCIFLNVTLVVSQRFSRFAILRF